MPTQPKPFADISSTAADILVPSGASGIDSPLCMMSRVEFQQHAKPAAGMQQTEIAGGEAAAFQQPDGKRIAERKLHQRRRGRRQIVRAGLARLRQHQRHIGGLAQRAVGARGHGDRARYGSGVNNR